MTTADIVRMVLDIGLGALALMNVRDLSKIVHSHEARITKLENTAPFARAATQN